MNDAKYHQDILMNKAGLAGNPCDNTPAGFQARQQLIGVGYSCNTSPMGYGQCFAGQLPDGFKQRQEAAFKKNFDSLKPPVCPYPEDLVESNIVVRPNNPSTEDMCKYMPDSPLYPYKT